VRPDVGREAVVSGTDGGWWADDRLVALLTGVRDDEEDERAEVSTPAAQDDQPAGISLEAVVTAGRAAFCWLDVVVSLRNAHRHQESVTGASTAGESGH